MIMEQLFSHLPMPVCRLVLSVMKHCVKQWRSRNLRILWRSAYGIDVGIGSYGCFRHGCFCSGDRIGNYCSIAGNVWHLAGDHPMDCGSMSPIFYLKEFAGNAKAVDIERTTLRVGHDVWIGQDVKILSKVRQIGNGAVIGAGSVVTHDVEPYTVVAGNPARPLRLRFDRETIALLEDSQWWRLTPDALISIQETVTDPRAFAAAAKRLVEMC